ncbi:MAG TPA: hypothetical protein PKC28_06140 [Bdellovibrionales bacterium]|nr:hypothetical protein [Bdellovibrionales bacterium]
MQRFAIPLWMLLLFGPVFVFAQPQGAGGGDGKAGFDAPYELGFHLGNLLPNQIDGVTEITGLGGARGGYRFAPLTYAETGLIMGNGEGAEWKNVHLDVRMDIPVENLVAVAYVGGDAIYYKGVGRSTKLVFGGHAGGGIMAHLTGAVWFRGDMKFGFSPGTSLYFGFGLVFRLGT